MARVSRKKKQTNLTTFSGFYSTALYIRLSNEEMDGGLKLTSCSCDKIKNQREQLIYYISDKEEHHLVDIYCDNGCSGTNFDRPEWQRLMGDVRAGKVNCIIVKDLSRLGRNYIETGEYLDKTFPNLGIRFIAVNDGYDTEVGEKGNNSMMLPLKNIINAYYAKDISRKIRSAKRMQRNRGEFTGSRIPFGYKKDTERKGRFLIDEESAKIVRMIFTFMVEGHSYSEIARELNRLKIPSPLGKIWNYQTIKGITGNEAYLGRLVQGKQCVEGSDITRVENAHEAIIGEELYEKVQRRKEEISIRCTPRIRDECYLFQGLLVAANNGKPLIRAHYYKQSGNVLVKAYRTPKTYNEDGEPYKMLFIREETLTAIVMNVIFRYLEILGVMECFLKQENVRQYHQQKLDRMEAVLEGKRKRLSRRKELLSDCYIDMTEGVISLEDYKAFSNKYREDITKIEREIREGEKDMKTYKSTVGMENPYIALLKEVGKTDKITNELLRHLIDKIVVFGSKELRIHFSFKDEFKSLQEHGKYEEII